MKEDDERRMRLKRRVLNENVGDILYPPESWGRPRLIPEDRETKLPRIADTNRTHGAAFIKISIFIGNLKELILKYVSCSEYKRT